MGNLVNTEQPDITLTDLLFGQPELPPSYLSRDRVSDSLQAVFDYVKARNYEGHDVFDGLNSKLFKNSPLYKSRLFRLALIQFCKKSPVDLRKLFLVPTGFNDKGGGLFLLGLINLYQQTGTELYANEAYILFQRLKHTCLKRENGNAWGYNFDWQARAFFVPVGMPNLVTSVYVGRAMLAYYHQFKDADALELALGVSEFLLNEMVHFEDANYACFNYIPDKDAEVHNANLLGAAFLAETLAYLPSTMQRSAYEKILKATRYSTMDIHPDGAWPYGTKPFHRWVDNFHTAFNIECLISIGHHCKTDEFEPVLQQVTQYYLNNLFTEDGLPKYYNNALYPIDIHVVAEAIVLMRTLRLTGRIHQNPDRVLVIEKKLFSLVNAFQNPDGFFYYQQLSPKAWNRISYIRWGQAWMFYALSLCTSL